MIDTDLYNNNKNNQQIQTVKETSSRANKNKNNPKTLPIHSKSCSNCFIITMYTSLRLNFDLEIITLFFGSCHRRNLLLSLHKYLNDVKLIASRDHF